MIRLILAVQGVVANRLISEQGSHHALSSQRHRGLRLGEELCNQGLIESKQVLGALSTQLGLQQVELASRIQLPE